MNQIITKNKFTKEEEKILFKYMIQVCKSLNWVETDSHRYDFILDPFIGLFSFSYYKVIIKMYYVIRSTISNSTSDESIRNTLYYCIKDHSPVDQTIKLLLKEGAIYRTQTIRYREEL